MGENFDGAGASLENFFNRANITSSSFLLVSFSFSGYKRRLHWHQRNLPSWSLSKVISVFMCFQWLEVGNPPAHHPVAHFDTLCPTAVLTAKASPASELATASCTSDKVVPDGAATCLEDSNQTNLYLPFGKRLSSKTPGDFGDFQQ